MKKHLKKPKIKLKRKPKSVPHTKWRLIPLFIFISVLAVFSWYRSVVAIPSINLADGLDAEEAAFLKKSVSVDKKKNSTGVAPAPVVKVTVKDKKTGEEYTSKVVLKNIDEPDKADVTTLTAAITKTVIENNTPVQPSPSPQASGITVAEPGTACGNIADGQWAQTGKRYQSQGMQECTAGSACSADITQCVQCVGGILDLANPEVCGKFDAINYIRETSDKVKAPCYDNKLMYADSTYLEQKGYCVNGAWAEKPRPVTPKNDLEVKEQEFLAEARRVDELHLTPSIAPSTKQDSITPPAPKPASDQVANIDTTQSINSTPFSNRGSCEDGMDVSKEQCDALPGGLFGRVPRVEEKTFTPFEFGSATAGKKSDGSDSSQNANSQSQGCNPISSNSCSGGACEFSGWDGIIPTWGCESIAEEKIIVSNSQGDLTEYAALNSCIDQDGIWNPATKTCTKRNYYPAKMSIPAPNMVEKLDPITMPLSVALISPQNDGVLGESAAIAANALSECQLSGAATGQPLYECFCKSIDCSEGTSGKRIAQYLVDNSLDPLGIECVEFATTIITSIGDGSSPICARDAAKGIDKSCLPKTESNGWYYCESPEKLYADDIGIFKGSGAESDPGHIGFCADGEDGAATCPFADMNYRDGNLAAIHPVAASELTAVFRKLPDGDPKAKGCWSSQTKKVY